MTGGRNSRQLRLNSVRPAHRNNFLQPRDDNFQSRQQQSDIASEETFRTERQFKHLNLAEGNKTPIKIFNLSNRKLTPD